MMTNVTKESSSDNPNALHDFHKTRRGPRNVPEEVVATTSTTPVPKDSGHPYARTKHISFEFFDQRASNASFGYEHYVSLPPSYLTNPAFRYPLILFLHGAGESERGPGESYASLRHGIPKIILCYDKLGVSPGTDPSIDVPSHASLRDTKQTKHGDKSHEPVPKTVCTMVAENFITITPSLRLKNGYGWNAPILSALLDEIVERYRVDLDRIHVTGFSMGGYGTWDLALHTPDRFASLVPICGGGDIARADVLQRVPQWVHHGQLDDIIPLLASEQMVDKLKVAGADIRLTVYPDLMHDSWTTAYNNIEIYNWMLRCRRTVAGMK